MKSPGKKREKEGNGVRICRKKGKAKRSYNQGGLDVERRGVQRS